MTRDSPPPAAAAAAAAAKHRRQTFQPSCPSGGEFYACDYGSRFVGCCAGPEPCVNGCDSTDSTALLKPASFRKDKYADLPGALCPGGSLWYKCAGTTPPFFGCCKTNPCAQNGCPAKDLMAATLASNPQEALPYSPIPNPSFAQLTSARSVPAPKEKLATGSPTSSSSLSSTTTTTGPLSSSSDISSTTTTTALLSESTSPTPKPKTIGATVGGVVGGLVVVLILIGTVLFFLRRRRKAGKRPSPSGFVDSDTPDLGISMTSQTFPAEADSRPLVSPNLPTEADSRPLVSQIDGSPISELYPSPRLNHRESRPLISQLDGSPISELYPSPQPIYHEFPS